MSTERLLVVGSGGMLGQDLMRVFDARHVVGLDYPDIDITNSASIRAVIAEHQPTIICNAAAYNDVDHAETDDGLMRAMQLNVYGPGVLARVCAQNAIQLVHYSTDYVFDGTRPDGYAEHDAPHPQSQYGVTKRLGEEAVLYQHPGAFVIRTSRLFGRAGASSVSKQSFVDVMLKLAQTKSVLDIVDEEQSCPTYTLDLARHTQVLLDGEYDPGIYHIANTGSCTWYEFAQEIFRLQDITITVNPVPASAFPRPAARPAHSVLLNTKLPPLRSWQEAVAEYMTDRT
jgi:dTDP-4-dehydrorhamnose reductase